MSEKIQIVEVRNKTTNEIVGVEIDVDDHKYFAALGDFWDGIHLGHIVDGLTPQYDRSLVLHIQEEKKEDNVNLIRIKRTESTS